MKMNKKLLKSYWRVFGSPEGEAVLEDLREVSGAESITDPEVVNETILAYQAGKRDFFLYINEVIKEAKGE